MFIKKSLVVNTSVEEYLFISAYKPPLAGSQAQKNYSSLLTHVPTRRASATGWEDSRARLEKCMMGIGRIACAMVMACVCTQMPLNTMVCSV